MPVATEVLACQITKANQGKGKEEINSWTLTLVEKVNFPFPKGSLQLLAIYLITMELGNLKGKDVCMTV